MRPSTWSAVPLAVVAVLCAAAVLSGTGAVPSATASPAVVGGQNADEDYPFMVSIQRGGEHFCGGSLLSPKWVLTAAHCVEGAEPGKLALRIGSDTWEEGGEKAAVSKIVVHPDFDWDSAGGDIALVRLTDVVAAEQIDITDAPEADTPSRILGWGQTCTDPGCGGPATTLQQLDVKVIDAAECTGIDAEKELCTSNPNGDSGACYGDSGGPQILKDEETWRLIGVTSRPGYDGASCAQGPTIYTAAEAYTDWITQTMNEEEPEPEPDPAP